MFSDFPILVIIGYTGSVLIAISLMMSAIVKLRVINFFGAATFSVYGFIIGAYPVAFLNGFIVLIDIYHLVAIFSTKEYFNVLEVDYNSKYLKHFLEFHKKDIDKFLPEFKFEPDEKWRTLFILRNAVPAGLLCAEEKSDGNLFMKLDYVIPGYRDFKIGKYVYQKFFKEKEVGNIFCDPGNKRHEKYLKKMGFVKSEINSQPVYCLDTK